MPDIRPGESASDFVDRCVPEVLGEGKITDPSQAIAICNSMYEQQTEKQLAEPVNAQGWNEQQTLILARGQPGGKFSKPDAGYMALSPGAQKVCGRCRFFLRLPGNSEFGMCEVVEGPIAPLGTSLLFIDAGQTAEYILGRMQEPAPEPQIEIEVEQSQFYDDDEDEDRRSKDVQVTADLKQEKPHKTVDGTRLFADDFASVGDPDSPVTWKLPIAKTAGKPDAERIAGAITAMQPGGFRGQRVELTAPKASVVRKIRGAINKLDDDDAEERLNARLDTVKAKKAGRRVRTSKVQALRDLKNQFEKLVKELGVLIGWAGYEDSAKEPWVAFRESRSSVKTFKGLDGKTYLLTWTTNAFRDRDGEIFTTKAIEDLVTRMSDQKDKGTFRFWHLPGSDFADIEGQAMSGRFLVEWGPFHDTPIGQTFKSFFEQHPQAHATIAPDGWGSSHGFRYLPEDRKDGVYEWFDKHETSVLPSLAAANPYNPKQEVFNVDDKQRAALEQIGGKDLVSLVETTGEGLTKDLEEADVAYKASFADKIGGLLGEIEDEALRSQVERIMTALGKTAAKLSSNGDGDGNGDDEAEPEGEPAEEAEPTAEEAEAETEKVAAMQAIDEELVSLDGDYAQAEGMKAKLANLGRQLKLVAAKVGGDVGGKLKQIAEEIIVADEEIEAEEEDEDEASEGKETSQTLKPEIPAKTETKEGDMEPTDTPEYVTREEVAEGFQVLGEALREQGEKLDALTDGIGEKIAEQVAETIDETPRASLKEIAQMSVIGKKETQVDGRSSEAKDGPEETETTEVKSRTGIPFIDQMLAAEAAANTQH